MKVCCCLRCGDTTCAFVRRRRARRTHCESCGDEMIHINNRPPGTRDFFQAREVIDAGFLELVRYGVRRADDPLMVDSLKVVDAVLKRGLPQGPGWLRYNWDGYGQRPDGGPFLGWGQGRVWPLLDGRARALRTGGGEGYYSAD